MPAVAQVARPAADKAGIQGPDHQGMTAATDPGLAPIDLPDAERYQLRDPREVLRVLHALVDGRALISAHLLPGGLSCPTALLEAGPDGVLLDGNRQEAINQRMAAADQVLCVSQLDRVRVQFRLQRLQRVPGEGPATFAAPLPSSVLQLQRRELYRLELIPGPVTTVLVPPRHEGQSPMQVRVVDISGGGVALAIGEEDQAHFPPGGQLDACTLELPDGGRPIPVRLQVAHTSRRQQLARHPVRVGCRFVDLPASAEQRILQFIFRVERQRMARERGVV